MRRPVHTAPTLLPVLRKTHTLPLHPCKSVPVAVCQSTRSGPGLAAAGPVPEIRTVMMLSPVPSGPPTAGPNNGSDWDRVHPDPPYTPRGVSLEGL